ncbi:MAG: class I SAM-dependent methyltransferase [Candidatus Hydrogenedentota bacterium]
MSAPGDPFSGIAPCYDAIMSHVDYERWVSKTGFLADLLPDGFLHIDVACGTGVLVEKLRQSGWRSVGADLSPAMVQQGRRNAPSFPGVAADMRALPFHNAAGMVTCLFDSLNFLTEETELERGLSEISKALTPGGLLYGDIITERMVLTHFAGKRWTEQNGRFSTTWQSDYSKNTHLAETRVIVDGGPVNHIYERIFPLATLQSAMERAGLTVLAFCDAATWKKPRRRSIRIDFVAARSPSAKLINDFETVRKKIQVWQRH